MSTLVAPSVAPTLSAPSLVPAPALSPAGAPPETVALIESIAELTLALDAVRASGRTVGFVPTMGALHQGHRALIRRAAAECDVVAVSVFVNPKQFGDPGDLAGYPRTLDADLSLAATAGACIVFAPSVEEMYPERGGRSQTTVSLSGIAEQWEGAARPGHFDGVATVVVKLLGMTGRCRAYFGEKDFQQLALVRRVVTDLSLPAEIVGCEIVRDRDGLALSSRNARLAPEQRQAALALSRALRAGADRIAAGEVRPEVVERVMSAVIAAEPGVVLDYAAVVRAEDLVPAGTLVDESSIRLIIAGTVGSVRLIDNLDPRGSLTPA
jgi:pantoate--beta-alanine ligase